MIVNGLNSRIHELPRGRFSPLSLLPTHQIQSRNCESSLLPLKIIHYIILYVLHFCPQSQIYFCKKKYIYHMVLFRRHGPDKQKQNSSQPLEKKIIINSRWKLTWKIRIWSPKILSTESMKPLLERVTVALTISLNLGRIFSCSQNIAFWA